MDFSGIIGLLENLNWNLLMVDRLLLIFKNVCNFDAFTANLSI